MTAEREGVAERWVAVLGEIRAGYAAGPCVIQSEKVQALDAAIRALRQAGEPIGYVTAKSFGRLRGGRVAGVMLWATPTPGSVTVYAAPPSPAKEG